MANTVFHFKQFSIAQDRCAMKVSTDACIQGAFTPVQVHTRKVLDIGTGTGLLSLMLAQKSALLTIDALEIDPAAARQARENFCASPFAAQLYVHEADARQWTPPAFYDLIICNPPFFRNSLRSPDGQRSLARHDDALSLDELAGIISLALGEEGQASVLLPFIERAAWGKAMLAHQLYMKQVLYIRPYSHVPENRMIAICGKKAQSYPALEELVIYREPKVYTESFIHLLQPYYLNL